MYADKYYFDYMNLTYNIQPKSISDMFITSDHKGKCLIMDDACGSWIISNNGNKLKRTHDIVDLKSIESYWVTYTDKRINYYMTNGHNRKWCRI